MPDLEMRSPSMEFMKGAYRELGVIRADQRHGSLRVMNGATIIHILNSHFISGGSGGDSPDAGVESGTLNQRGLI